MAIYFKTVTPKKLLSAYKKAIDDGHVKTWSYDTEGDFTHTAAQWSRKAWLRPYVVDRQELVFNILAPVETQMDKTVYAIYHGRFIESMLRHCDELFVDGFASALPVAGDVVSSDV